ncbi:HEPN domain-containing protein [Mucilaginibacter flavidus]|uniref:HEPN domain-containing protein n=1 Tax=Mucilaginibacter flavidus TaxID=2949309 RepID=UPI0020923A0C|nr:HEPN domain-containing protein [Mucilaginibacter flavidus]MCO5946622.1 HEPN domain-containing protein [Mucilaginibacter flavidus]
MDLEEDTKTAEHLENLMVEVGELVKKKISSGNVMHGVDESYGWKINNFFYTQNGVEIDHASRIIHKKKNWTKASFDLSSDIYRLSTFLAAEKYLRERNADQYAIIPIQSFIYKILPVYFEGNGSPDKSTLQAIKNKVISELNGDPVHGTATVHLSGVILDFPEFRIDEHAILRQTKQSDFEQSEYQDLPIQHIFPFNTAILEITYISKDRNGALLQQKVEEYMALLKLYFPGSIQYRSYEIKFDIITPLSNGGNMGIPAKQILPWQKSVFKKEMESSFINFIKTLVIPKNFYAFEKKVDYISTAFDRYNEALTENVPTERRIANAMMGIEALLSNDTQELSFKMQTRTSKILGVLGFKPLEVRSHLSKAYGIRSKFAHGGYLTDGDKSKFITEFINIDNFALIIINYVRIVLVTTIAIDLSKNTLISLLDDSFIDDNKVAELKNKLENIKELVI